MSENLSVKEVTLAIFNLVENFGLSPAERVELLISVAMSIISTNVCIIGETHEERVEILDTIISKLKDKIHEVKNMVDKKHFMVNLLHELKKDEGSNGDNTRSVPGVDSSD